VKHLLTGLTVPRQYVCLPLEDLLQPLSIVLSIGESEYLQSVTLTHVFLGYKPLIVLLPLEESIAQRAENVCLTFVHDAFTPNTTWNGFRSDRKSVARLILKRITSSPLIGRHYLFEGVYGEHRFLNQFHRFVNKQRDAFRKQSPENVSLPGNLYDQVRIAYSVARTIPLITLGNRDEMNMFPTDLHGPVGNKYYVSSLRVNGKANAQVEMKKQVAMSFMPVDKCQFVYSLGKNHMQQMRPAETFDLNEKPTATSNIPLPANLLRYCELKQVKSFDAGIHRIHLYEKMYEEKLKDGSTLAHIHQYYAQWRINRDLPTPIVLPS
jgi:hypothetical protein